MCFLELFQHLGKVGWSEDGKTREEALVIVQVRAEGLPWTWYHFLIHSADLGG